jgi:hypothetical protein
MSANMCANEHRCPPIGPCDADRSAQAWRSGSAIGRKPDGGGGSPWCQPAQRVSLAGVTRRRSCRRPLHLSVDPPPAWPRSTARVIATASPRIASGNQPSQNEKAHGAARIVRAFGRAYKKGWSAPTRRFTGPGPHRKSGEIAMTIAGLAAALRGMPRHTRLVIDTPQGLKDLRWVRPTHGIHPRSTAYT